MNMINQETYQYFLGSIKRAFLIHEYTPSEIKAMYDLAVSRMNQAEESQEQSLENDNCYIQATAVIDYILSLDDVANPESLTKLKNE